MDPILEKLSGLELSQREILIRLDNTQKTLDEHTTLLKTQGETLLRNTITVEQHEKRSTMLENRQDSLETQVENIQTWVNGKKATWKSFVVVLGVVGTLVGIVAGIVELYKGGN